MSRRRNKARSAEGGFLGDGRVMAREPVKRRDAARRFDDQAQRTKAINTAPAPMRGGIRL